MAFIKILNLKPQPKNEKKATKLQGVIGSRTKKKPEQQGKWKTTQIASQSVIGSKGPWQKSVFLGLLLLVTTNYQLGLDQFVFGRYFVEKALKTLWPIRG